MDVSQQEGIHALPYNVTRWEDVQAVRAAYDNRAARTFQLEGDEVGVRDFSGFGTHPPSEHSKKSFKVRRYGNDGDSMKLPMTQGCVDKYLDFLTTHVVGHT